MNHQKYGIWIPLCYSTKNEKGEEIIKLNEFVFKLENEYKEYLKDNEINYSTFN